MEAAGCLQSNRQSAGCWRWRSRLSCRPGSCSRSSCSGSFRTRKSCASGTRDSRWCRTGCRRRRSRCDRSTRRAAGTGGGCGGCARRPQHEAARGGGLRRQRKQSLEESTQPNARLRSQPRKAMSWKEARPSMNAYAQNLAGAPPARRLGGPRLSERQRSRAATLGREGSCLTQNESASSCVEPSREQAHAAYVVGRLTQKRCTTGLDAGFL